MRRQMAHPAGSPLPRTRDARRRAQPPRRGARRFIGPAILGILGIAAALALLGGSGAATAGAGSQPASGLAHAAAGPSLAVTARPDDAPPCEQGDVLAPNQGPDDWAVTVLDTRFMLRPDAVPPGLVPVTDAGIAGRGKVRELVIGDLRALAAAASSAGAQISVDSAYRSFDQQVASYSSYAKGYGEEAALQTVARPGHSEHQLGTTLDFAGDLEWLAEHAWRFGFVMSYPEDRSPEHTCYRHEAWHYRYVGRETAAAVRASGLSLREWLWRNQP